MKIEYKIFRIVLFTILSVPFFFFGSGMVKMEFDKYVLYGQIKKAVIVKKDHEIGPSSGLYGGSVVYTVVTIDSLKSTYLASIATYTGVVKDENDQFANFSSDLGDAVEIKVLSSHNAKILKLNGQQIAVDASFWSKFLRWVLILALLSIGGFLIYKVYTTIKTKTTWS